jgi:hypothetical protein
LAKGEARGLYIPTGIEGASAEEVAAWAYREFMRISVALEIALVRHVEMVHAAPEKPREGMIAATDGTTWNPPGGSGVYAFYAGDWHKLG